MITRAARASADAFDAHLSRVLTKLDVRDRTQAVITAFKAGLAAGGGPPNT